MYSVPVGSIIVAPLLLIALAFIIFIIGIVVTVVLGTLIVLIPAFIVAYIVWWLTGSETLAAVAFLLITLSSFLKKRN